MRIASALAVALALLVAPAARAADRYFQTSDGVRLHYIEAAPRPGPTNRLSIVFVPGWTMPAWIWQPQIAAFSRSYHVVAFDPRGQGDSDIAPDGYEPFRRGQDIAELIQNCCSGGPVLVVGWSLGVLDSLAYVSQSPDPRLAGLVLVDNSVGEDPAPVAGRAKRYARPTSRPVWMAHFVRGMFRSPPDAETLDRLTETCLRTPPDAAARLLAYPVPRTFWKDTLLSLRRPVLYIVTPRFAGQAGNLAIDQPLAETVVLQGVGHAMFWDDPNRFNALISDFIARRVAR